MNMLVLEFNHKNKKQKMETYKEFIDLKSGLLFLDFQQGTEEPEYEAMGRITKKHKVFQTRWQYANDLERAIKELELTSIFLLETNQSISAHGKQFDSEEIISYYEGIFLDCVHQIKDKLFRLVWWMLQDEDSKTHPNEPDNIKIKSFKPYEALLKYIGVLDLLKEWNQDANSGIAVALKKRTHHHHFVSKLQLDTDYQKIRMSKIAFSGMLSEYGKTRVQQISNESYVKWKALIVDKQEQTQKLVLQNINGISKELIKHFKIPTDVSKYAEVIDKYVETQKRFDIENKTDQSKIKPEIKKITDEFIKFNSEFFKEKLISIYLTGSVPRGEFVPGASDINLIIIVNFNTYGTLPPKVNPFIDVYIFGEQEFLSKQNKKWRFICWSDGLPIYGKEYDFDKKEFPKPGTLLTLLLNRGFIEKLEEIKNQVSRLENPNKQILRYFSLKAVKIMLDFQFGVAMANRPFYTSNRAEKIRYIKQFPNIHKQINTFESIYKNGIIHSQDFSMIIDTFLENARRNYKKIIEIEEEIINEQKNTPLPREARPQERPNGAEQFPLVKSKRTPPEAG